MKRLPVVYVLFAVLGICFLIGQIGWSIRHDLMPAGDPPAPIVSEQAPPEPITSEQAPLPEPQAHPSQEALAFGEQQVEHMVEDRPQMKQYVQKGDPIWRYCVRQFAGEALGERIAWNNDPLELAEHYDSESQSSTPTQL